MGGGEVEDDDAPTAHSSTSGGLSLAVPKTATTPTHPPTDPPVAALRRYLDSMPQHPSPRREVVSGVVWRCVRGEVIASFLLTVVSTAAAVQPAAQAPSPPCAQPLTGISATCSSSYHSPNRGRSLGRPRPSWTSSPSATTAPVAASSHACAGLGGGVPGNSLRHPDFIVGLRIHPRPLQVHERHAGGHDHAQIHAFFCYSRHSRPHSSRPLQRGFYGRWSESGTFISCCSGHWRLEIPLGVLGRPCPWRTTGSLHPRVHWGQGQRKRHASASSTHLERHFQTVSNHIHTRFSLLNWREEGLLCAGGDTQSCEPRFITSK
ncbi:uncharacterized protein [Macrobrachium rosenbergii]|uniref:uncharacterized protein isoform X2 n=1 Tax=Macrobrachium rosenbergii TaxID=79674 RepID=UPI0034D6D781